MLLLSRFSLVFLIIAFFTRMPAHAATLSELDAACRGGDSAACKTLALAYFEGSDGLTQDAAKTITYVELGCKAKDPDVCAIGYNLYKDGLLGITVNQKKAFSYLKKSCTPERANNCTNYGAYLSNNNQSAAAIKYFEMACKAKDQKACYNLGMTYFVGDKTVAQDHRKAYLIFSTACVDEYAPACFALAGMVLAGQGGVEADRQHGIHLLRRSLELDPNYKPAADALADLEGN